MHSGAGDRPSRRPGSPIRTPPDQRSVDSSPGPIAASHVLHRLLVPRHPPCALDHLHTTHTRHPAHGRPCPGQRSASSRHYNRNLEITRHPPHKEGCQLLDARIHYPVHKHPTATQTQEPPPTPHTHTLRQGNPPPEAGDREEAPVSQAVPPPS